ncbi:MAG: hypothetical protein H6Q14_1272 [Bacteroidetes bacterium]|jgi:uncharacterized membrane protein YgdD (TMEM256/DUF423 family)|nr:hypothetical protein [Bacteroidota bacterium]
MTKQIILAVASFYGLTSVIFGALGSHALAKVLSPEKLSSFEVGVRYQMYHALALLLLGFFFTFQSSLEKTAAWSMVIGTLLFSGSIYLLSMAEYWKANLKFLGPVTPLGGLFLIVGWGALLFFFVKGSRI